MAAQRIPFVLPGILRDVGSDLVHFTNCFAPVACTVPHVVTVHDISLSLFPEHHTLRKRWLTPRLVSHVARAARRDRAFGGHEVRLLGIDRERMVVIPEAPPAFGPSSEGPARLAAGYGVRPPYLLYVGTIEPRKNLLRMLRAFERVAHSPPAHQLGLVGNRGWKCGASSA